MTPEQFVSENIDILPMWESSREGWHEAFCWTCYKLTTGVESVCEEWAYEHAKVHVTALPVEGIKVFHAPGAITDAEIDAGVRALDEYWADNDSYSAREAVRALLEAVRRVQG